MQQSNTKVIFTLFIIVAMGIIGYFIYTPHQSEQLPSTFSLSPQPSNPQSPPTTSPQEPLVTSWTTYTNNEHNFTLPIPQGWNQQEYKLPNGSFIVAFSPGDLPCGSCSYVHEGYFSIHIFNQQTDPESYKTYTESLQKIGKVAGFQGGQIDNVKGVIFGNTVEVENHGWVYELVLDQNNGNDSVLNSKIFVRAASSMQFTYLIFNP